jgi:hypothetical protein
MGSAFRLNFGNFLSYYMASHFNYSNLDGQCSENMKSHTNYEIKLYVINKLVK